MYSSAKWERFWERPGATGFVELYNLLEQFLKLTYENAEFQNSVSSEYTDGDVDLIKSNASISKRETVIERLRRHFYLNEATIEERVRSQVIDTLSCCCQNRLEARPIRVACSLSLDLLTGQATRRDITTRQMAFFEVMFDFYAETFTLEKPTAVPWDPAAFPELLGSSEQRIAIQKFDPLHFSGMTTRSSVVLYRIACMDALEGNWASALTNIEEAIQGCTSIPEYWHIRASSHFNLNEFAEARADYENWMRLKQLECSLE